MAAPPWPASSLAIRFHMTSAAPSSQGWLTPRAYSVPAIMPVATSEAGCPSSGTHQGACGQPSFVESTLEGWPHAPWWVPEEGHPASLVATGMIAGTLYARGVSHPWLDGAAEVMWNRIAKLDAGQGGAAILGGYEMFGVLGFLQHV